jgi:hypothetical protein
MPSINVNMYIPIEPELVPLWTNNGTFASAQEVTHNIPSGYSANSYCSNPYYIQTGSVSGDEQLIIYVPNGAITKFYINGIGGTWTEMNYTELTYFTSGTTTVGGVQYTTYTYSDYDRYGDPVEQEIMLSFDIT